MVLEAEIVRRFNRYYTERIGVLSDHYLGQRRPLAEARLLFEIGYGKRRVRELRIALGLDSGYLARLLRSLERQRLVTVTVDPSDRRARIATLTRSGTRELEKLDERSDAAAKTLLAPLSDPERERLLVALLEVHRLLLHGEVTVEAVDPVATEAQACFLAYAAELDQRFPEGFDQADLVDPEEIQSVGGTCLVARHHQRTIGCSVLRRIDAGSGEIKHLWVDPDVRGLGVSRLLLAQIEQSALAEGMTVVRLDTHATLTEATNLYRTSGYVEIPPYGANPHAHLWFEKRLAGPTKR